MVREIKGKYSKGVIHPLEELDLKEGEEVVITVKETIIPDRASEEAFRRAAGSWEGALDFDAFLRDLYNSRRRQSPEVEL
jgi:predicted DNA-binding antitoxin AbrB/MazE fold protein